MPARLKVFRYSDGFHAWTVAASSRPKALAAWGVERDLFKDGAATEIDAGDDYDAALAAPGELIERGLTVDVGEVGKRPRSQAKRGPTAAQKAAVKTLERELATLDAASAKAQTTLSNRVATAQAALADRRAADAEAREALEARLRKARNALK